MARQLFTSLVAYMNSDAFAPRDELDGEFLQQLPQRDRNVKWSQAVDRVVACREGYDWKETTGGTWKDADGAGWHGNPLQVLLRVPAQVAGDLYVHLHDWNGLVRQGHLLVDGRRYNVGSHDGAGRWYVLPVGTEETQDKTLQLVAKPTRGPNLMITQIMWVPKEWSTGRGSTKSQILSDSPSGRKAG